MTVTSSVVPSGYVTKATPLVSPLVVVTGGVFHVTLVRSGNAGVLVTLLDASGTVPLSTFWSTPVGLYCMFCGVGTVTLFVSLASLFPK